MVKNMEISLDDITGNTLKGITDFIDRITYNPLGSYCPEVSTNIYGSDILKVSFNFKLEADICQDDWRCEIRPGFRPNFHWAPHLTPEDGYIISWHSFRSPCMIMADCHRQLTVIPDLDMIDENTSVSWYMDLNAKTGALTLGMSDYATKEHTLYIRQPGACHKKGTVRFGFFIMLSEDVNELSNPWRKPLEFLWRNWGRNAFLKGEPTPGRLECYLEHTYKWALERWSDSVWQEFRVNGKKVGAPVFIVNTTQSPNYPGPVNEREFRSIWNQAWFSSIRSAQGLFRYGRRTGNAGYIKKALLTKELALSAPQKNGFFPSVIGTDMVLIDVNGQKVNRSLGWDNHIWGNSDRNPFSRDFKKAPYHVLDMSWTAFQMLQWYEELEKDERLVQYALAYADSLLDIQDDEGFFPAWLNIDTLEPMGVLDQSPETSLSSSFLLKLFNVTGKERYLLSALKGINAVMEHIIPEGRWEDFETYWSCSPYGRDWLIGKKAERNGMHKQCNFSMYWTTEALFHCYKTTGNRDYLKMGQRCLDEMLMTQASWQPPYMQVKVLGGFGVMNCDAEWNDARQSLFSELIILYGKELGEEEYIQRGLAALRASFVMMYCPENPKVKGLWEKKWPFFDEKDFGFTMENYGHDGIIIDASDGIGEFTIYDWGNGAASESYMRIADHFGEEFLKTMGDTYE